MPNPVSSIADAVSNALGDAEPVEYDVDELMPHLSTCISTHATYNRPVNGEGGHDDEMGIHFEVVLDGQAFEDCLRSDTIVAAYDLQLEIETSGRVLSDDDRREFRSETSTATVSNTNHVTIAEDPERKEAVIATHDHDIPAKATSHLQFTVTLEGTVDAYDGSEDEESHIGTIPVDGEWDIDAARIAPQIRGISTE